ncbi:hypothetical protein TNIN_175081 [Trichonephila inaurata madagascariensis]|uniref:Uncharacterized protein n=1 Tax=Trichonephila inaurata madagascariensis TaxID=2747483 RepID=A0A8X6XIV6_9ARAC|nr:hypothetical protein TNIN_175081 [Trichonephila inaurata madagascariensis]
MRIPFLVAKQRLAIRRAYLHRKKESCYLRNHFVWSGVGRVNPHDVLSVSEQLFRDRKDKQRAALPASCKTVTHFLQDPAPQKIKELFLK